MSFYGSVSNAGKTTLTFDKVYPNRQAMETYCKEDGVFIGRCVLIEYDDNTFAYVRGYTTDYPAKDILYHLYADVNGDIPLKVGENVMRNFFSLPFIVWQCISGWTHRPKYDIFIVSVKSHQTAGGGIQ